MGLNNSMKHRMLNHAVGNAATGSPITHASLHTGYPCTTGNEVTGGSPAYARKALTFEAVAGTELAGSLDMSGAPVFDVPAGTTVSAVGFCSASSGNNIEADMDVTNEVFAGQGTYTLTDFDLGLS